MNDAIVGFRHLTGEVPMFPGNLHLGFGCVRSVTVRLMN